MKRESCNFSRLIFVRSSVCPSKPIFMAYYHEFYTDASIGDYFSVMWHGLPLDFTGRISDCHPGFLLIASAWTKSSILRRIRQGYFGIIAFVMSCIFIIDLGLYGFWGFRLDATPISISSHLRKMPWQASALVHTTRNPSYADLCSHPLLYFLLRPYPGEKPLKIPYQRQYVSLAPLLLTAPLHPYPWRFLRIHHELEQSIL